MANTQTTVPKFVAANTLAASSLNISAGTGVPVFANTTTRDAAFGGSNKALAEGQLCYIEASNVVQYYDGAAWATVGPAASKIVQVQTANLLTTASTSSSTFATTGLTVSITPTSATSTIFITAMVNGGYNDGTTNLAWRLYRNTTAIAVPTAAGSRISVTAEPLGVSSVMTSSNLTFVDSPATTSATSYSVYFASLYNVGTAYINRSNNDTDSSTYARAMSTITVFEVLA